MVFSDPSEKYANVKLEHFPKFRDEHKKSLKSSTNSTFLVCFPLVICATHLKTAAEATDRSKGAADRYEALVQGKLPLVDAGVPPQLEPFKRNIYPSRKGNPVLNLHLARLHPGWDPKYVLTSNWTQVPGVKLDKHKLTPCNMLRSEAPMNVLIWLDCFNPQYLFTVHPWRLTWSIINHGGLEDQFPF